MKEKLKIYPIVLLLIVINGFLYFESCKREERVEMPDVTVNPAFEMMPPIAKEVTIQKVENSPEGNLLVVADFGKGILKDSFLAINLSTGKVLLRDDGKGGDVVASDGKFSIIMNENIDSLNNELEELDRSKDKLFQKSPVIFQGRHVVRVDSSAFRKMSFRGLKEGVAIPLPSSFCRLLLNVSIPHSLMVTNTSVVEDLDRTFHPSCLVTGTKNGAWTFQKLISDMANTSLTGVSAEDFVKDWLETWLNTTSVNSETVTERDNMFTRVIQPWVIESGSPSSSFNITNWRSRSLNLEKAPFKLIAIVNRLDLRGNIGYGISNAGEGRFIFEVLEPSTCNSLSGQFTVIFEYGLPIKSCSALKDYGQKWYDLKNQVLGSDPYNSELQALTDVFALANADPSKPNGSSLNQIRTNERAIGAPWELREFNIDPTSHKLKLVTVKQEPAEKYNESSSVDTPADVAKLVSWINTNEALVLLDKHTVTETLPTGEPFLGGKAHSEPGLWSGTGILNPEGRHHFSFNTCSGCHRQETNTSFVHLSVVPFGTEAIPSGFLSGTTVPDPVSGVSHGFNDFLNRQIRLEDLLCNSCKRGVRELFGILKFDAIKMTH